MRAAQQTLGDVRVWQQSKGTGKAGICRTEAAAAGADVAAGSSAWLREISCKQRLLQLQLQQQRQLNEAA